MALEGKKWLHMAEEGVEAQPGMWMSKGPTLTSAWIKLEFISLWLQALLSYTERLHLDREPWGYEDLLCVRFKTSHEPTVLSTDYLKGTRENVEINWDHHMVRSYLID